MTLENATLANISFSDTQIKIKRGTAAEWTAANPTLEAGELGYISDTNTLKIGDGTTAYTSLAALVVSAGAINEAMLSNYGVDGLHTKRIARATYDFDVLGGEEGDIGLCVTLPANAIITRSWYTVLTTFTSADDSATVAISIPTDDVAGIVGAVAIGTEGNAWDEGHHEGIQTGTVANFSEQTTAARELTLTVGVQDLTAGKLILFCEYVICEPAPAEEE